MEFEIDNYSGNIMIETSMDKLIEVILKKLDAQGNWQISRNDILDLLGLEIQDVYKRIVSSTDPMVDFKFSSYSQNDVGSLISLLECFGYNEAPQTFWRAGLWIPYPIQVELQEILIDEIAADRTKHKIDYDAFLSIFDHVSSFPRSIDVYLEEFFSREEISHRAILRLLEIHSVKAVDTTELLLQKLIHELFRREIVPYRTLFSDIFIKLKAFLIYKGRIESPPKQTAPIDKVQINARQLFGFSQNQQILLKELKKRYKNLMKQYHPDVNPQGLELAKDINRAYSVLLP